MLTTGLRGFPLRITTEPERGTGLGSLMMRVSENGTQDSLGLCPWSPSWCRPCLGCLVTHEDTEVQGGGAHGELLRSTGPPDSHPLEAISVNGGNPPALLWKADHLNEAPLPPDGGIF